jgi:CDP-glycerol glycerophosphotransferase
MPPRISVIVPVYNVDRYLVPCLESIATQTFGDLEVIMVDDGSTDGSAALAEDFAGRDPRFRLVQQTNGGLSKARNTGIEVATGEFVAFVDSDDVLPPTAYELLIGALEKTGSDFATGNVYRLTAGGTSQARFLARTFAETRFKTHVTRDRSLLADRTAWNKLFRRPFWEAHGWRFPEGRYNEDIPVILPAHFAARSVDVISEPVYYYRIREGGNLSITQRRVEEKALLDRMSAVEYVSDYLAERGPRRVKRWYDVSVVADDLSYYLNALESADDHYRALFLDRVNAFLDRVKPRALRGLPTMERLKWHLVRRRMMPELLELLRFQREDFSDTPPVRIRGHYYADHPFRTDPSAKIPPSLFCVDRELRLHAELERMRWEGAKLRIDGWAVVEGVGAPERGAQKVTLTALRPGRLARVRLRVPLIGIRSRARVVPRPDLAGARGVGMTDTSWAGFAATLPARRLRTAGRWRDREWNLYVTVKVGRLRRRRVRYVLDGVSPPRAAERTLSGGAVARISPSPTGEVRLSVRTRWARITGQQVADGALELSGELRTPPADSKQRLELRRSDGTDVRRYPLTIDRAPTPATFRAVVPLHEVLAEGAHPDGDPGTAIPDDPTWQVSITGSGLRVRVALAAETPEAAWREGGQEVALVRSIEGHADIVARPPQATVTAARWTDAGELELQGDTRLPDAREVVLLEPNTLQRHAFPLTDDAPGRFTLRAAPARIPSLAGELPLTEGSWELYVRGEGGEVPLRLARTLHAQLPLQTIVEHKRFSLSATIDDRAKLVVRRDLDDDERGRAQQRRLRESAYARRRQEPLEDVVVYTSFRGRQYSDNPRAIHEELVRREVPLRHLWVVRDGMCRVPRSATVVRDGSREHYDAMARARYVVSNDHFPDWFARRPDQVCLQTWHGTPLKRLGLDVSEMRGTIRRFQRRWDQQVANWQHVLSPNRFSTPILQRAYAIGGEMLETGYPRVDALARADRDVLSGRLRRQLGVPDHKRVVLYAPTYRDHVKDARGRYRLELRLDLERLHDAVGDDCVILFRKHHYIVDPVPATSDGFVRDVSSYPDGTELLLAADVLVTDYSSMMVDFANTGRPMLFYTYDLDAYRDEIRGFYLDLVETAPGPMLRTTDELIAALQDLDGVQQEFQQRYSDFAATFCELDDGRAAARVVDRVFAP